MSERLGIILTAGVVKKERLNREIIEPDMEGKVRCLGALDEFAKGQIDKIGVTGGMKFEDEPFSKYYVEYLLRFTDRYHLSSEAVRRIPGRLNTSTDLQRAVQVLGRDQMNNSVIYSSGFHLKRALPRLRTLGVKAKGEVTEEITSRRSRRHPKVVQDILEPVEASVGKHEFLGRLPILLDQIPVIGKLHIGLWMEEFRANRQRLGE